MNPNTFIAASRLSPLCRVFDAVPRPHWQEGFPLHFPHATPGPVLAHQQGQQENDLPSPVMAVTFALKGVSNAEWGPRTSHTLHLALPADEDTLETRAAVLLEFSDLLLDMTQRGTRGRFVTVPTPVKVYGATVIRHAPVAVFDPDSGEALWVHPSADAFDLLAYPIPGSQWARKLGESALGQDWGDFSQAPLLDPATGLPGWAAMMRAALTNDLGRPVTLAEAVEAVITGLEASEDSDPAIPWRARATAQVEAARQALFGGGPPDPPDGPHAAQAASSTSAR